MSDLRADKTRPSLEWMAARISEGMPLLHAAVCAREEGYHFSNAWFRAQYRLLGAVPVPCGWGARGEENPAAVLTVQQVRDLRRETRPLALLARRWGIAYNTLWNAKTGATWAWLT